MAVRQSGHGCLNTHGGDVRRFRIVRTFICAKNEAVVINGEVVVTVIDILNKKVVLAVDAPEWVEVCEKETSEGSESMLIHPR